MRLLTVNLVGWILQLCFANYASGQSRESIQVCGVDLKPGMARDSVLKAVAAKCELQHVSAQGPEFDDLWFLSATPAYKSDGGQDGSIYFFKGVLTTLSKDVGSANNDAAGEIVNQIYVFTKEADSDGVPVTVSPSPEFERDGWRYRVVTLSAGKRTLTLQTTQPIGKSNAVSRIKLQVTLRR